MAKFLSKPIESEEITRYLESQDDFALEMRTYSLITSLGFSASHGGTYEDPVTHKYRQYDIRAYKTKIDSRIDLAIECKSLKDCYPLIVSRVPRATCESYHEIICSIEKESSPYSSPQLVPSETVRVQDSSISNFYPENEPVGKSTTQLGVTEKGDFVPGDSEVFDKWTQAIGSLTELASKAAWYKEQSTKGLYLTTLIPILVVPDRTLWVADYDTSGNLIAAPYRINATTLFLGREYWKAMTSYNFSHLHLFTSTGLEVFLRKLASDEKTWETLFPMKQILERLAEA